MFKELFKGTFKNWTARELLGYVLMPALVFPLIPLAQQLLSTFFPEKGLMFSPSVLTFKVVLFSVGAACVGTVCRALGRRPEHITGQDILRSIPRWLWGLIAGMHGVFAGVVLAIIVDSQTGHDIFWYTTGAGFLLAATAGVMTRGAIVIPAGLRSRGHAGKQDSRSN